MAVWYHRLNGQGFAHLLWTQLCPVVDSVLGVVNELLGAVLGKSGSTLLLLCTCSYLSTPLPQWVGYQRRGRGRILGPFTSSSD